VKPKSQSAWGNETKFFFELSPEKVLNAVESYGIRSTGRCFGLNSYENRVYEVELDEESENPLARKRVIKFYRPGRWSREQILEEHQFLTDLKEAEIPVISPIPFSDHSTLQTTSEGLMFTVFPKVGGRIVDELDDEQLHWLGRLVGRIHSVGNSRKAQYRIRLTSETYGVANLEFLLQKGAIPGEWIVRYENAAREICNLAAPLFEEVKMQRIHGDCHHGNLLWDPSGPFFLDFDDMCVGPPVQDFWLLFPSQGDEGKARMEVFLEGYESMNSFDRSTLRLVEFLRALRFIHYTAWIARRWDDPAFKAAFPHFNTGQYWNEKTRDLEDQLVMIKEELSSRDF